MGLSNWYVIYTRSRCEKVVSEQLMKLGVETYLPLNKSLRQWSDRKKWVEIPLIPSYVFVRMELLDPALLAQIPAALCFVRYNGRPARLKEGDINDLKNFMSNYRNVVLKESSLSVGNKVRVNRGLFKDQTGEITDCKKNFARLRIDVLDLDLFAEIALSHLERV